MDEIFSSALASGEVPTLTMSYDVAAQWRNTRSHWDPLRRQTRAQEQENLRIFCEALRLLIFLHTDAAGDTSFRTWIARHRGIFRFTDEHPVIVHWQGGRFEAKLTQDDIDMNDEFDPYLFYYRPSADRARAYIAESKALQKETPGWTPIWGDMWREMDRRAAVNVFEVWISQWRTGRMPMIVRRIYVENMLVGCADEPSAPRFMELMMGARVPGDYRRNSARLVVGVRGVSTVGARPKKGRPRGRRI
ncbi:hypothetical protein DFH07DRAFT_778621 [Mycena maculata]|uniref:Uncharacterized protein n=1 Tax=Mycena maculata TaxID=230809 RepID=A0AAD7MZX5_9AGAR|nr:hypothetical protein DFH07DRAFT_778621 [Mycena maculata]